MGRNELAMEDNQRVAMIALYEISIGQRLLSFGGKSMGRGKQHGRRGL